MKKLKVIPIPIKKLPFMRLCNKFLDECPRRNKLRDYKRIFVNEKLLFRNGIKYKRVIPLRESALHFLKVSSPNFRRG